MELSHDEPRTDDDRPVVEIDAETIVRLLAEPVRLRIVAALVLGAEKIADVAQLARCEPRDAVVALRKLEAAGLVSTEAGVVTLHQEAFGAAARATSRGEQTEDFGVDAKQAAVLRNFVKDGRLLQIPMSESKRRIVLEHLVTVFEPGVRYPEREVNTLLAVWHADYAALRRYLVEGGLMTRDAGVYWRSGGWVDVGTA